MGTNFYMITKNKDLVEKYFPYEYEIVDTPYFGYEIHIGKRSCGWKPLFRGHSSAYRSVAEMLSFLREHPDIEIFDEYNRQFTVDGLKEELVDWGDRQENGSIHYSDEIGEVLTPIDHQEMQKLEQKKNGRTYSVEYRKDDDGYEFLERSFE